MKKVTTIMLFLLFSLMLLSGCGNKKEDSTEVKEKVEENIIENQISEEDTTGIEIAEKLKVPELTESDLKYFDKEKFNESQQDYENELDMFLSDGKIEEENKEEIIKEDTNIEEVKEENKEEKTNKTKEKTTTSTKENNMEKKTNETTTNKNQQTKNKNVSTKNKTTIKEQLELQQKESKESKCKKKGGTYNKSQDFCYQIIELE